MVASAHLAYQARRGAEYGVRVGPVSVDLAAVRERKQAMVVGARQNYANRLPQDGLDLIEGEARFTGEYVGILCRRCSLDCQHG
jgi:pyruvate/2-oxoglutarate dehydrogenase complex dihydrolipoamide dehydrogenase (E3) component